MSMKRCWAIAIVLFAALGIVSIALLARGNLWKTNVVSRNNGAASASEERRSQKDRLTSAEQEKIILGNITTVPFQELYDLLAKRNPEEIAALTR
jgi:hypothetical protein